MDRPGTFDLLQGDLNLANDRLSHTMYRVLLVQGTTPDVLRVTLLCDCPDDNRYTITCPGPDAAVRAIWQLCALGLWLFSFDAIV